MWIFSELLSCGERVALPHRNRRRILPYGYQGADMDRVRMTGNAFVLTRRNALVAEFVCRLVTFCLIYSMPALAHDQGRHAQAPRRATAAPAGETLDPKHEKDHDEARGPSSGLGRGHIHAV